MPDGRRHALKRMVVVLRIVLAGGFALFGGGCTVFSLAVLVPQVLAGDPNGLGFVIAAAVLSVLFLLGGLKTLKEAVREWKEAQ